MKKRIFAFSSLLAVSFAVSLFAFSSSKASAVKASEPSGYSSTVNSSQLIKDYASMYETSKSAQGDNFDSESVMLTEENDKFTYGVAHGNLTVNSPSSNVPHINAFDTFSEGKFTASSGYASIQHVNEYINPSIHSAKFDGIIFWFEAKESLSFSMPYVSINQNSNCNNLYRRVYVKKSNTSSYEQKSSYTVANKEMPAIDDIELSAGDTLYYELCRRYNDDTVLFITGTPLYFNFSRIFSSDLTSTSIIKDYAAAFDAEKAASEAQSKEFVPSVVALTDSNNMFTYGVAHGSLYGDSPTFTYFDAYDSVNNVWSLHDSSKTTAEEIRNSGASYGVNYNNPGIYTYGGDGFIFWFTAKERITFSMPEFNATLSTTNANNLYRKIFVKRNGASKYDQKVSQLINSNTITEVSEIPLQTGDTVCFEFRRVQWGANITNTAIPFHFSNRYGYVQKFIDEYLHMADYDPKLTGQGDGSCTTYYPLAKQAYLELDDEIKVYFCNSSLFTKAYERFSTWAIKNNDSIEKTTGVLSSSAPSNNKSINNSNYSVVIVTTVFAATSIIAFVYYSARSKKSK